MEKPQCAETVVVIGGGVSGLATAALLARRGHDVTLVEKNSELGGRAGSHTAGGFRWDTGPSWYLMPEVFERFYSHLGMTADNELDLTRLDPAYAVWDGPGEPLDVRSGRARVRELFESLEPGSSAALDDYLDSAKSTYDLALRRFLYNRFDARGLAAAFGAREVLVAAPRLVSLLLRSLHAFASGRFRNDTIRKILDYPAVFLGSSPFATPALYHLMSHLDLDDGVYYPRGGFTTFVESLRRAAEREGVRILTDTEALEIKTRASHSFGRYTSKKPSRLSTAVEKLKWRVPFALRTSQRVSQFSSRRLGVGTPEERVTGVRIRIAGEPNPRVLPASAVIGAHDIHHLEQRLLPPEKRTYPQAYWDRKTPGPGALVLMLGVRGELPQLRHHNLLFAEDWEGGFDAIFGSDTHLPDPASLYICKPSATDETVAPAGHENLFVLVPAPADVDDSGGHVVDPGALGFGDGDPGDPEDPAQAAADRVIEQIARWTQIPDLAERIVERRVVTPADFAEDVYAWRGTALGQAHTLAQSAMFRTKNSSRRVEGLYYAGSSTLPGIGLPMCLISAELAVHAVEGTRAAGPTRAGSTAR